MRNYFRCTASSLETNFADTLRVHKSSVTLEFTQPVLIPTLWAISKIVTSQSSILDVFAWKLHPIFLCLRFKDYSHSNFNFEKKRWISSSCAVTIFYGDRSWAQLSKINFLYTSSRISFFLFLFLLESYYLGNVYVKTCFSTYLIHLTPCHALIGILGLNTSKYCECWLLCFCGLTAKILELSIIKLHVVFFSSFEDCI